MTKLLVLSGKLLNKIVPRIIPQGYGTKVGGLMLMALGVVFFLDQLLHDNKATADIVETAWLTAEMYKSIGATITGWTGVRLAAKFDPERKTL